MQRNTIFESENYYEQYTSLFDFMHIAYFLGFESLIQYSFTKRKNKETNNGSDDVLTLLTL